MTTDPAVLALTEAISNATATYAQNVEAHEALHTALMDYFARVLPAAPVTAWWRQPQAWAAYTTMNGVRSEVAWMHLTADLDFPLHFSLYYDRVKGKTWWVGSVGVTPLWSVRAEQHDYADPIEVLHALRSRCQTPPLPVPQSEQPKLPAVVAMIDTILQDTPATRQP